MADTYLDEDGYRAAIHDGSALDTDVIERCLNAASREVDKDTGRFFYADDTATAHTFAAESYKCCELTNSGMSWDIYTATDLVVKTDTNGDGTYDATWTINTDFILEPVNQAKYGIRGWPYESIRAVGSRQFPVASHDQPYPVQVTAKWGWAEIPEGIAQATLLMANAMYKRPDAPFGVAGFDGFGAVRVRSDPLYLAAIEPFTRVSRMVA